MLLTSFRRPVSGSIVGMISSNVERLVPQILISGDLKGHTFGIIDDQRAARHVGNHIFVVRVIGLREEGGVKVAVVGQLALVQLLNQPLLAQNVQASPTSRNFTGGKYTASSKWTTCLTGSLLIRDSSRT